MASLVLGGNHDVILGGKRHAFLSGLNMMAGTILDVDRINVEHLYQQNGAGHMFRFLSGIINVRSAVKADVATAHLNMSGKKIYGIKTLTADPVLADLAVGEIQFGEVGAASYVYFKCDAARIIKMKEDGTFSTIS
ncbi:hypothetical protein KAR91_45870 [Candidatus Pacearchaeota archaeon]|nr:hypothetical protein [Candidatus Pacearchaeota archaeon]